MQSIDAEVSKFDSERATWYDRNEITLHFPNFVSLYLVGFASVH